MLCQLCGETNPDGAEKCSRCGDILSKTAQKKTPKASRLLGWMIIIAILMIIAAFVIPDFMEPVHRPKTANVRTDLRSISTALEAYYVDDNRYPLSFSDISRNLFARFGADSPMSSQPTFGLLSSGYANLTSPVPFMDRVPYDPFAPARLRHAPFCYYTDPAGKGWILWSAGPDMKYDLTSRNIGGIYNPANPNMVSDPALLSLTFDPTNGSTSHGDIWRISGNQPVPAFSPVPTLAPTPAVSWVYDPTNGVTRSGFGGEYRIKQ